MTFSTSKHAESTLPRVGVMAGVMPGAMPTLAVGMLESQYTPQHAHDKRGHGTRNVTRGRRQVGNLSYGRGFTLVEVMLALGLSLVAIAAVGSAIHMYSRLFDSGRTNIEEAQLARAILHRMADDIRGAVLHNAVDISKLVPQTSGSTSGSSATSTSDASSSTNTSGANSSAANSSSNGSQTSDASDLDSMLNSSELEEAVIDEITDLSSTGPQTIPGIYGNACQLQIDVSRLPRIDQYLTADQGTTISTDITATSQPTDRISDLKNVAYYIIGDSSTIAAGDNSNMQSGVGLVRREMDRASALFATQMGEDLSYDQTAQVIAPEISSLQFAYFDGTTWYDTWDSSQYGGLPLAVQITIMIARTKKPSGETPPPGVYSLLVHIPIAKVASEEDTSSSTSTPPQDSATSSSDSQNSSSQSSSTSSSSTPSSPPTNNPPNDQPQSRPGGPR